MPLNIIRVLAAIVVVSSLAVGSTLVWPNMASSTGSQDLALEADVAADELAKDESAKHDSARDGLEKADVATADFDHAFASVAPLPRRAYIPEFLTMIDFERLFTGTNALPRRHYVPVRQTAVEFERVFISLVSWRRDNTPPNREKLRNAGWKRILEPG
jgi:hypothetical protein